MQRVVVLLATAIFMSSCGASVRHMSGSDWHAAKADVAGKKASVVIGNDIEFSAQVLGIEDGMLSIDQNGTRISLPEEVVTRIRLSGERAKGNMLIGGGFGAVAGIIGGYFVGAAAGEGGVGAAFHPLSMVVILGSTVGGAFIGSNITQSTQYELGNKPTPYILGPEAGTEIGAATISAFGLFDNLTGTTNEKLIQLTIYKLKSGQFLLVYDVRVGTGFQVRWKMVDESYINIQRAKLNIQG